MGQAKARGTLEERKARAELREAGRKAAREEIARQKRAQMPTLEQIREAEKAFGARVVVARAVRKYGGIK